MSGWGRANSTQKALSEAEEYFGGLFETDGEIDEAAVEQAYAAMQCAAVEADEAIDEIRQESGNWAAIVARTLR